MEIFRVFPECSELLPSTKKKKQTIESILKSFRLNESYDFDDDLKALMAITSEVKAITNQAVILHGERIKRAQEILKKYRDGAFTAWLFATYGNRQTPYNFLQYYEFYTVMPQALHPKLDQMPRQAVYSLASRAGALREKRRRSSKITPASRNKNCSNSSGSNFLLLKMTNDFLNFAAHAIQFSKTSSRNA